MQKNPYFLYSLMKFEQFKNFEEEKVESCKEVIFKEKIPTLHAFLRIEECSKIVRKKNVQIFRTQQMVSRADCKSLGPHGICQLAPPLPLGSQQPLPFPVLGLHHQTVATQTPPN